MRNQKKTGQCQHNTHNQVQHKQNRNTTKQNTNKSPQENKQGKKQHHPQKGSKTCKRPTHQASNATNNIKKKHPLPTQTYNNG